MKQLDAYRFYELGAKLHELFSATGCHTQSADMFAPLTEAQALLDGFIKGDVFTLDSSKNDARRLLDKIGAVFNRYFIDPATKQLKSPTGEDRIDPHELSMIRGLVEKFEHALAAELNRAPTYFAGRRGIYSTYDLAENAQQILPESLQAVLPTAALKEFGDAGRALAFGLGTAAAVHMLRAVEIVARQYYECFNGSQSVKGERNYASTLKKLAALADDESKTTRPDRRVVQTLAQIKDHYRNPLVTPDSAVSVEDATQLFGMASAIASLMAEQIASFQKTGGSKNGNGKPALPPSLLDDGEEQPFEPRLSQAG